MTQQEMKDYFNIYQDELDMFIKFVSNHIPDYSKQYEEHMLTRQEVSHDYDDDDLSDYYFNRYSSDEDLFYEDAIDNMWINAFNQVENNPDSVEPLITSILLKIKKLNLEDEVYQALDENEEINEKFTDLINSLDDDTSSDQSNIDLF